MLDLQLADPSSNPAVFPISHFCSYSGGPAEATKATAAVAGNITQSLNLQ